MAESTAIERVDAQVRHFASVALEREGVVTGWVLMVATSRFDEDGDMCHAYDYSVSPDTDMMRAVGLVELARGRMQRDIYGERGDD